MTSNACSKLLLVVMLLAALSGAIVPAAANDTPPSENPDIVDVLEVSKLQAPSSGDNIHDLIGYSSSNFFLQDDGFVRFITTDDEQRSELRIPREDEFDGAIKTEERLEGRLRLPATDTSEPESGERPDQYTFMQLHATNRDGPLVRLVNYGYLQWSYDKQVYKDYLWSVVDGEEHTHQPMILRPSGEFDAAIVLEDGELVVELDGSRRNAKVSWGGDKCYFKAGSYVQEGPHESYWVDYRTLKYTGSYD